MDQIGKRQLAEEFPAARIISRRQLSLRMDAPEEPQKPTHRETPSAKSSISMSVLMPRFLPFPPLQSSPSELEGCTTGPNCCWVEQCHSIPRRRAGGRGNQFEIYDPRGFPDWNPVRIQWHPADGCLLRRPIGTLARWGTEPTGAPGETG